MGIGELETALETVALGMDGPCFHRARGAIDRAEARGTPLEIECGETVFGFEIYALLYGALRRDWTERQRQVMDLSMMGMPGNQIASLLGITASAVSQHLSAAKADVVDDATRYWLDAIMIAFCSGGDLS